MNTNTRTEQLHELSNKWANNQKNTLTLALIGFKDAIIADYEKNLSCVDEEGNLRFGIDFEVGKKYVKVVSLSWSSRSVHSFVEIATGDIWRAASWKAPARNFVRGNVFKPDSYLNRTTWTGVV